MKTRLRNILLTLLLFAILAVPAAAASANGVFGDYAAMLTPDMPSPFTPMLTQLQKELFELAGIKNSITVVTEPTDLQEHADAMFAELYDSDPDYVTLYYRPEDNDVGIAYGENVAAVLTEDDEAAIRAAFAAPETDDGYTHVLNGMKQLNICVFDGGDYDVPDLSYTAQFLRAPDDMPVSAELPRDIITPGYAEVDERRLIELRYLVDEIDASAGISTGVVFLPTAEGGCDALAESTLSLLEQGSGYASSALAAPAEDSRYPAVVMAFADDTDAVAVRISETMGDALPADAAERLAAAISGADGDGYDHAMAGLTELAKILFADGSREYDPNSGIALALDPDAFAETGTAVPTVWIAVAALAAFALAAVAVLLCLKKKRSH